MRSSDYRDLTGEFLVFWMDGYLRKVVAHGGLTVPANRMSIKRAIFIMQAKIRNHEG